MRIFDAHHWTKPFDRSAQHAAPPIGWASTPRRNAPLLIAPLLLAPLRITDRSAHTITGRGRVTQGRRDGRNPDLAVSAIEALIRTLPIRIGLIEGGHGSLRLRGK